MAIRGSVTCQWSLLSSTRKHRWISSVKEIWRNKIRRCKTKWCSSWRQRRAKVINRRWTPRWTKFCIRRIAAMKTIWGIRPCIQATAQTLGFTPWPRSTASSKTRSYSRNWAVDSKTSIPQLARRSRKINFLWQSTVPAKVSLKAWIWKRLKIFKIPKKRPPRSNWSLKIRQSNKCSWRIT